MSALAVNPQRIKSLFVDQDKNEKGIYTLKLYIRGKPWLVQVDDVMLVDMQSGEGDDRQNYLDKMPDQLRYAKYESKFNSLWAPILEKAFMKVRGNYLTNKGGQQFESLQLLTGAPSFRMNLTRLSNDEIWDYMKWATDSDYP